MDTANLMFIIAGLILLQQYMAYGVWFSIDQIHHETFALVFAAIGLTMIAMRKRLIR